MDQTEKSGSKFHFLDLRIPLGGLLVFYGVVLVLYGLLSNPSEYAKSFGLNVNLIWGGVVLLVGALLIVVALVKGRNRRGGSAQK
jgi:membrane-bound ClpP family serine protease